MYGAAILFPGHPYIESATALSNEIRLSQFVVTSSNGNYHSIVGNDCKELKEEGHNTSGIYTINPADGGEDFEVRYCTIY